jgi:hypothetical protein
MIDKLTPPWHPGIYVANRHLRWLPTDTKEIFEKMMQDPVHQQYFKEHGWLDPDAITYNINSHGFRSDEFTNEPCILALGCSYTVGIGLPVSSIWPTLVGQALNLKVYNLAWGGSSADTCFRLACYWVPQLKPVAVFMLTPPVSRIELLMAEGNTPPAEVFLPMSESGHFSPNDIYLKHWFINEDNAKINSEKNKLAINALCDSNNSKFYSLNSASEMARSREEVGYARDYMHAGVSGHKAVSDKFLKKYYEQR